MALGSFNAVACSARSACEIMRLGIPGAIDRCTVPQLLELTPAALACGEV
jgi:hypothetical protein